MNKIDASSPCNPSLGQRDREISLKSPWQNPSEEWRGDCEYPIHSQIASSQKNNSVKADMVPRPAHNIWGHLERQETGYVGQQQGAPKSRKRILQQTKKCKCPTERKELP